VWRAANSLRGGLGNELRRNLVPSTLLFLALSAVLSAAPAAAQTDGAAGEANAAYDRKDWAKATRLYEAMVKAHPETPRSWLRLATSQQESGQLDQALQTLERGLEARVPPLYGEFLIAGIYAQKGDKENVRTFAEGDRQRLQPAGSVRSGSSSGIAARRSSIRKNASAGGTQSEALREH